MSDLYDGTVAAIEKIEKYFEVSSELAIVATILDPRFKLSLFKKGELGNEADDKETEATHRRYIVSFWQNYRPYPPDCQEPTNTVDEEEDFFGGLRVSSSSTAHTDELDLYLNSPCEPKTIKPYLWWAANTSRFPYLSKLSRDVLAIPGASTSSERAFSSARRLITWERNALQPATVRAAMCCKDWCKSLGDTMKADD
jgi:hypothetical protein